MALDLGGTNFRVLLVIIKDKKEPEIRNKIFTISDKLMTGPGNKVSHLTVYRPDGLRR